ncbi:MAG: 8-amino-7-oxononanoate synthase [Flavobacteriaceae bacterium]|nr:8-amino-7-oxononanoate synthase [Flavobacteriaceae bacterium]
MLPKKLQAKLQQRIDGNMFRSLPEPISLIDFSSNDYLGFGRNEALYKMASQLVSEYGLSHTGASGSRLLSGNHALYHSTEAHIAKVHNVEAALIFNSGYDANLGFFGCVPQRGDLVFYDALIHASIREGIQMGLAKGFKFPHNRHEEIEKIYQSEIRRRGNDDFDVYVVTESVFSMDGDSPDLKTLCDFCANRNFHLVVDEAHALGVLGDGYGLVQFLGLEELVFARLVTFGKALGCHGAAILGSELLKDFLTNFARSLIYTTALPPHSVASVLAAYGQLALAGALRERLWKNNARLKSALHKTTVSHLENQSPIHSIVISGNDGVQKASRMLRDTGFDVKPILSPTVPIGKERLRICMHSFNTETEILELASNLNSLLSK